MAIETKTAIAASAMALHMAKQKNNYQGQCGVCKNFRSRSNPVDDKEKLVSSLLDSTFYEHYRKCRVPPSPSKPARARCLCWTIRQTLKALSKNCFSNSPLSLQLIASCAVSTAVDASELTSHPFGEEVLELKNAAMKIQKKWRKYLKARGLYRVTLCRYYLRGNCRNGIDCTFAHGAHDVRPNFVQNQRQPLISDNVASETFGEWLETYGRRFVKRFSTRPTR